MRQNPLLIKLQQADPTTKLFFFYTFKFWLEDLFSAEVAYSPLLNWRRGQAPTFRNLSISINYWPTPIWYAPIKKNKSQNKIFHFPSKYNGAADTDNLIANSMNALEEHLA